MSVKIEDQTCQNCRHFNELQHQGQCRRYPPTTDRVWPFVYRRDWCGEWAADAEEEAPAE